MFRNYLLINRLWTFWEAQGDGTTPRVTGDGFSSGRWVRSGKSVGPRAGTAAAWHRCRSELFLSF